MRILMTHSGDTIKVSPLVKRERFPPIIRLKVVGRETYAVTKQGDIAIGSIPADYKMVSIDKYEIIFKSYTPVKSKYRNQKK